MQGKTLINELIKYHKLKMSRGFSFEETLIFFFSFSWDYLSYKEKELVFSLLSIKIE